LGTGKHFAHNGFCHFKQRNKTMAPWIKRSLASALLGAGLFGNSAQADTPLIDPAAPGAAPRKIALVAAVGNSLHMISARQSTGSNIDPFNRVAITLPEQTLNNTVLQSMDRAVSRVDAQAQRILLHVSTPNLEKVTQSKRADVTAADLLTKLSGFEERQNWDLIVAATPRYQHSGFNRMGDKLWGLGVYIHGVESANVSALEGFESFAQPDEEVLTAKQKFASTQTFVAPFAYLRFTVFDAKTLKVIRTVDKLEARKTADPDCTATHIANCFTGAQYAGLVERIAQRTVSEGIAGGKIGTADASEPKLVQPQPVAK
jgi:hypothetical protein